MDRFALDTMIPRIVRNMSYMVSGATIVALIGIAVLAVTARAIGPAGLGIIALVEAYVRAVDLLFRLKPTQALIKYGSEALEARDEARFQRLVKSSLLLDIFGGAIAGGIALALGYWAAPLIGLGDTGFDYIFLVALSLFVALRPTGMGVMRLFDRFDALVKANVCVALLRLAIALVALALDLGIWAFVVMVFIHSVVDGLVAFLLAVRELRKHGYGDFFRQPLHGALTENEGIARFTWNSNVQQILRQSTQRFDVLALGAMTNPAVVGIYQVVKRTGVAAQRFGQPLAQVLLPELSTLWVRGQYQRFRWLVLRTIAITFALGFALYLPVAYALPYLVETVFGTGMLRAAPLLQVYGIAVLINISAISLAPALLSMGRDRELVRSTFVSAILFGVAFVPLTAQFEAMGSVLAHILFSATWFSQCFWAMYKAKPDCAPRVLA